MALTPQDRQFFAALWALAALVLAIMSVGTVVIIRWMAT
jgi:hypothetical protein